MQFAQLRYVLAVAAEHSFTAAAHSLGVAQPTVSAGVRALEEELGTAMFLRERGDVQVTAAGEAFLPWARQALADVDRGRTEVADLIGLRAGRLAVGATPSLAASWLPPVLATYHRSYPAITLAVRQAGSRELMVSLAEGLVDVALVILGAPVATGNVRLATLALATEELVLAVAPGHPLAGRDEVGPGDLADHELVLPRPGYDLREVTVAACRAAGFDPVVAVEAGEMDGVLALVAAGLGAAVVPVSVVTPAGQRGLRAVRFTGASLVRTIGLAERADRPRSVAAEALVDALVSLGDRASTPSAATSSR